MENGSPPTRSSHSAESPLADSCRKRLGRDWTRFRTSSRDPSVRPDLDTIEPPIYPLLGPVNRRARTGQLQARSVELVTGSEYPCRTSGVRLAGRGEMEGVRCRKRIWSSF